MNAADSPAQWSSGISAPNLTLLFGRIIAIHCLTLIITGPNFVGSHRNQLVFSLDVLVSRFLHPTRSPLAIDMRVISRVI